MFCKHCGKDIGDAKFCPYCGKTDNEPTTTPSAVQINIPALRWGWKDTNPSKAIGITGFGAMVINIILRLYHSTKVPYYTDIINQYYWHQPDGYKNVLSASGKPWMIGVMVLQAVITVFFFYQASIHKKRVSGKAIVGALAFLAVQILAMLIVLPVF